MSRSARLYSDLQSSFDVRIVSWGFSQFLHIQPNRMAFFPLLRFKYCMIKTCEHMFHAFDCKWVWICLHLHQNRKAATTDTVSEIWIHSPVWSFVCIYVMFLHYQNAQHWHCTLKIGLKEFFFVSIFGLWLSVDFCTMALRTQASGTMPTKNTYWTIYE